MGNLYCHHLLSDKDDLSITLSNSNISIVLRLSPKPRALAGHAGPAIFKLCTRSVRNYLMRASCIILKPEIHDKEALTPLWSRKNNDIRQIRKLPTRSSYVQDGRIILRQREPDPKS